MGIEKILYICTKPDGQYKVSNTNHDKELWTIQKEDKAWAIRMPENQINKLYPPDEQKKTSVDTTDNGIDRSQPM